MAVKKFRIVVDGVEHEVEVEELGGVAAPAAAAAPAPKAAPAKKAAPVVAAGASDITAPLQGTIQSVAVKAGDAVKAGQVVLVIEAMKMENEVVAPRDGVVASVSAKAGDKVSAGDILVSLQ